MIWDFSTLCTRSQYGPLTGLTREWQITQQKHISYSLSSTAHEQWPNYGALLYLAHDQTIPQIKPARISFSCESIGNAFLLHKSNHLKIPTTYSNAILAAGGIKARQCRKVIATGLTDLSPDIPSVGDTQLQQDDCGRYRRHKWSPINFKRRRQISEILISYSLILIGVSYPEFFHF